MQTEEMMSTCKSNLYVRIACEGRKSNSAFSSAERRFLVEVYIIAVMTPRSLKITSLSDAPAAAGGENMRRCGALPQRPGRCSAADCHAAGCSVTRRGPAAGDQGAVCTPAGRQMRQVRHHLTAGDPAHSSRSSLNFPCGLHLPVAVSGVSGLVAHLGGVKGAM
jgi:hypothetical protein